MALSNKRKALVTKKFNNFFYVDIFEDDNIDQDEDSIRLKITNEFFES